MTAPECPDLARLRAALGRLSLLAGLVGGWAGALLAWFFAAWFAA